MGEDASRTSSREERLAAKLRENLRRRKAQSRQLDGESSDRANEKANNSGESGLPKGGAKS